MKQPTVASKEAYLAFVADYKRIINDFAIRLQRTRFLCSKLYRKYPYRPDLKPLPDDLREAHTKELNLHMASLDTLRLEVVAMFDIIHENMIVQRFWLADGTPSTVNSVHKYSTNRQVVTYLINLRRHFKILAKIQRDRQLLVPREVLYSAGA